MADYLIIHKCGEGYHIQYEDISMFYLFYSKKEAEKKFRQDFGLVGKRLERIEY